MRSGSRKKWAARAIMPSGSAAIPEYLTPYVATQDASLYTAIDHASWRFIMRLSRSYFAKHAHQKYLDGLRETGISTDRIPLISEMDAALRKCGWGAVPVVGFIPPAVFMEFLSLGLLPIACDMRRLEHIEYTPAPDIVHEAAGHAPIIADPEYAEYLKQYGEIARKVIFSIEDLAVYEAIRELSDLKENPNTTAELIATAQSRLDAAVAANRTASEATQLGRMGWWTIEYGLVGPMKSPKIYGAGLLSSIKESYHCLGPSVRKLPFSIECIEMSYDITKPQPQLYVTPNFETLRRVLEAFAQSLAFRQGGAEGLERARQARTVTTTKLDSGLEISGVVADIRYGPDGMPSFVRYTGRCQLAFEDEQIHRHGPEAHPDGFSAPIGRIALREPGHIVFESGIELRGELVGAVEKSGRVLVLSFAECTITDMRTSDVLYRPEWGRFDLAVGERAVSVFGGAADRAVYLASPLVNGFKQIPQAPKTNLTLENRPLNDLYQRLRDARAKRLPGDSTEIIDIYRQLKAAWPCDWLLRLELLELSPPFASEIREQLQQMATLAPEKAEPINRGLALL